MVLRRNLIAKNKAVLQPPLQPAFPCPAVASNKICHSAENFVANLADRRQRAAFRISQSPFLSMQPRDERTFLATAHRYQKRRSASELLVQKLRASRLEIEPCLPHHRDHLRVNLLGGLSACWS